MQNVLYLHTFLWHHVTVSYWRIEVFVSYSAQVLYQYNWWFWSGIVWNLRLSFRIIPVLSVDPLTISSPMNWEIQVAGNKRRHLFFQISQMKEKDGRIKLITEILNGMKVLKLYAWEESFQNQILGIREREVCEWCLCTVKWLFGCDNWIFSSWRHSKKLPIYRRFHHLLGSSHRS